MIRVIAASILQLLIVILCLRPAVVHAWRHDNEAVHSWKIDNDVYDDDMILSWDKAAPHDEAMLSRSSEQLWAALSGSVANQSNSVLEYRSGVQDIDHHDGPAESNGFVQVGTHEAERIDKNAQGFAFTTALNERTTPASSPPHRQQIDADNGRKPVYLDSCVAIECGNVYIPFNKEKNEMAICRCDRDCVRHRQCCEDYSRVCNDHTKKLGKSGEYGSALVTQFWIGAFGIYLFSLTLIFFSVFCFEQGRIPDGTDAVPSRNSQPFTASFLGSEITDSNELVLKYTSIKFRRPSMERLWRAHSEDAKITTAARMLVVAAIFLIVLRMRYFWIWWQEPCLGDMNQMQVLGHTLFLFVLLGLCVMLARRPSMTLYYVLIGVFYFYIPAQSVPPFNWSCHHLKESCKESKLPQLREAFEHVDCSLLGMSTSELIMVWIMMQPWVILALDMMNVIWIWIITVVVGWRYLYQALTEEDVFDEWDQWTRTAYCLLVQALIYMKKYNFEKMQRLRFLQAQQEKATSQRIFCFLEYMMPQHVIGPMLRDPTEPIAEQVDRVSILFVLIADFDRFTKEMTPSELLRFLNKKFTAMDRICEDHQVTKIETVGEEYVACVGVMPHEREENEQHGHGFLLDRLFKAGGEILELQTEEVMFKMGVHTGPIVAGVIGTKLPRFRLFGDTINSAARMMQKGNPGQLQFGKATYEDLSDSLKGKIKYRGEVQMKGKGAVEAWTFEPPELHGRLNSSLNTTESSNFEFGSQLIGLMRSDATSPDPEGIGSNQSNAKFDEAFSQRYEEALGYVNVTDKTALFSQQECFPDKLEEDWRQFYFETMICQKAKGQFAFFLIALVALTAFDFWYGWSDEVWRWPFEGDGNSTSNFSTSVSEFVHAGEDHESDITRQVLFLYCRLFVVLVFVLWWYSFEGGFWVVQHTGEELNDEEAAVKFGTATGYTHLFYCSRWGVIPHSGGRCGPEEGPQCPSCVRFQEAQAKMRRTRRMVCEHGTLLTTIVAIGAMFISYDALLYSDSKAYRHSQLNHFVQNFRAPDDQAMAIEFVLVFWVLMQLLPFRYISALFYFVPAALLIRFHKVYRFEAFSSEEGQALVFLLTILIVRSCYEEELVSRARYKGRRAVAKTQERTEYILKTLMPQLVVKALSNLQPNASLPSDQYRHVMLAQSDLCGFTQLSSTKTPQEVVKFMGELFGAFDRLTDKHEVYKVETIGDAYIAGMAEPPLTEKYLPANVVVFGLDMVRAVDDWAAALDVNVTCRVGIHYGECMGGIVGTRMQRYHLFGDLMTVMDTLEATSIEGRVQVSKACKDEVERQLREEPSASTERLSFKERPDEHLKTSKGEVHEYAEVGGRTYLVESDMALRRRSALQH